MTHAENDLPERFSLLGHSYMMEGDGSLTLLGTITNAGLLTPRPEYVRADLYDAERKGRLTCMGEFDKKCKDANEQRALRVDAEARVAVLEGLIRRVVNDPVWRTNDNSLWPDLCAALEPGK